MRTTPPLPAALALALVLALAFSSAACTPAPEPRPATPSLIRTGETIHVVRTGDTLFSIARLYGVTEQSIRERNPGLVPDTLAIGREVRIPPSKPEVRRVEPAAGPARPAGSP